MDCDQVRDSLEALNAGELPRSQAAAIADHLASCPGCHVECEEMRELAADLRHAGEAVRPPRPFEIPTSPVSSPHTRRGVVVLAAVVAVWALTLTTAMLWPSLAARLTFLPVGSQLRAAAAPSPIPSARPAGGHTSLADLPSDALGAVVSLFGASRDTRAPARAGVSAKLAQVLREALGFRVATVDLIALGPLLSVTEGQMQLMATVDVTPAAQEASSRPQRYELLVTVSRSAQGGWRLSQVAKASGSR